MKRKILGRIIVMLLSAIVLTFVLRKFANVNLEEVKNLIAPFGILAPIIYAFILTLGLTIPFNPVSDFLTVNAAAFLFSPITSIVATFIAHSASLTINYFLAKKFGDTILKKITSKKEAEYIEKYTKKLNLTEIFALRFVLPITQVLGIDVISYAAGIEKISFGKFFFASIIPWTILSTLYFYGTSYFKHYSIFLFFAPAAIIIFIPFLAFALRRFLKT